MIREPSLAGRAGSNKQGGTTLKVFHPARMPRRRLTGASRGKDATCTGDHVCES